MQEGRAGAGSVVFCAACHLERGHVGCTGPIMQAVPPFLITRYASQMPRCGSGQYSMLRHEDARFIRTVKTATELVGQDTWLSGIRLLGRLRSPPSRNVSVKSVALKREVLSVALRANNANKTHGPPTSEQTRVSPSSSPAPCEFHLHFGYLVQLRLPPCLLQLVWGLVYHRHVLRVDALDNTERSKACPATNVHHLRHPREQ